MKQTTSKHTASGPKKRAVVAHPPATGDGFAKHAEKVFDRMREAMTRLIEAIPEPIHRAVDLQRALGVYAPLAWRVFRIAGADEPLQVAEYVPTPGHVETLLQAAKKKGIPARIVAEVREAMAAYEDLRKSHAGSREKLRSMTASLRPAETDLIDAKCRRATFENNSLIWGVQTDVLLACAIFFSRPQSTQREFALLGGRVGFHAVRPGAAQSYVSQFGPDAPKPSEPGPSIDNTLLREFCSPAMDSRTWQGDEGLTNTKIARMGIGRRSSLNHFHVMGAIHDPDEPMVHDVATFCPAAWAHLDLLVPTAWRPRLNPVRVYGCAMDVMEARKRRPADLLPVEITAAHLGTLTDVPAAAGVPRYAEMVRKVLENGQCHGTEFEVYRCRMQYPILHSMIHMAVTLGEEGM